MISGVAATLAEWAHGLHPGADDVALAHRSLLDTVAVAVAAREHPVLAVARSLTEPGRWAVAAHVLDFDDLHMRSTTHVSAVCVSAALAAGGDARAYLAGAGVMARLGNALGWRHYAAGWHATCTAGAPAAAVTAAVAYGLDPGGIATALALALPGAGGVQRAFGTDAKSLQVGFAVESGLRAARLAAAGARADLSALEAWLALVGAEHPEIDPAGPAVPGGLAVKVFPACYALQRPISAVLAATAGARPDPRGVGRIVVRTPVAALAPLLHHRPRTGLEAKFSLEYGLATALLDEHPGFASFTDAAVARADARRIVELVEVDAQPGGDWLLAGDFRAEIETADGTISAHLDYPPGSPQAPPDELALRAKLADCVAGVAGSPDPAGWDWHGAGRVLRAALGASGPDRPPPDARVQPT